LIAYSYQIERDAEQSLDGDKYITAMAAARSLRLAAGYRSIRVRRLILRNAGFEIRSRGEA
jgi:hypothetical protein